MKKNITKFLSFYLLGLISDNIVLSLTLALTLALISSLTLSLIMELGFLFGTLTYIIFFIIIFIFCVICFKLAFLFVYSKKNKNAAIIKFTHSFTMIANPKLRGKNEEEIMNYLKKDYKNILDYGVKKYPNGIKITTHALVVKNLIDMGYGTKKEYNNCISNKKYIVKEKFYMLNWKQFKKHFIALFNKDHRDKDYLEAKKLLKTHNRYIFIIKLDDNNKIKIEKVK